MATRTFEEKKAILKIQSEIRKALGEKLRENNFIEISPVILSPITDPLNHPTAPATIQCYGNDYSVTQSMIFHKQLALRTLDKIFIFSPNIRLEQREKQHTGRHLFEFTQLDVEMKNASREDMLQLCETLLVSALESIKTNCTDELHILGRAISIPKTPFKKITYKEANELYGKEFEMMISRSHDEPVWLIDIPLEQREFYDKEDPSNPGYLRDMDLIYPEGYGEALSGGEREYEYERIVQRILRKGQPLSKFTNYLKLVQSDLPSSAGFGIGIERLTRYVCGLQRIEEASLFPKIPGNYCI
jgi:asparaginyl-tRNA synthetase